MKLVFWISAFLIGYVYAGYPLWAYFRSRWRSRPWRQDEIFPTVSVVMAVYNEAERIQEKLNNLFQQDYPANRLEVVVVSDGSQDRTSEVLAKRRREGVRVFHYPEHRGKAVALNLGIQQARGEIVVFTDARQRLEPASMRYLVSNFSDSTVGCVTGELILRHADQTGTQAGVSLYWRYEKWMRKWEARTDSMVGATGAIYAVRRELLGTLPEGTILDDVYLPLQVVRAGYRAVFDPRARAWDSLPESNRDEFRRRVRTLAGNYQLLQLAPWLLHKENRIRFQLISHKLLRLFVPFFLAGLFLSSWWLAEDLFYWIMALLQSSFYLSAALGLVSPSKPLGRLLAAPAAFGLLNAAAVMGFVNFLFHRAALSRLWVSADARRLTRGGSRT